MFFPMLGTGRNTMAKSPGKEHRKKNHSFMEKSQEKHSGPPRRPDSEESGLMDLGRIRRRVLREFSVRKGRSWSYFAPEFRAGAEFLRGLPDPGKAGEILWQTRRKLVTKIAVPAAAGGDEIVFKSMAPRRRFLPGPSPALSESINYRMLALAGFPMAELLGAGEARRFGCWQKAFLITRFVAGSRDGRAFLDGGGREQWAEQDEFIRGCLRQLAGLHDLNYFHKGFKPYNILWCKPSADVPMRLVLIDVATGRLVSGWSLGRCVKRDLGDFFETFVLSPEKVAAYIRFYRECRTRRRPPENLPEQVLALLAARRKRKRH